MNQPPEQDEPKDRGENELEDGHEQPPLEQLSEAGNKETAKRRNHVTS